MERRGSLTRQCFRVGCNDFSMSRPSFFCGVDPFWHLLHILKATNPPASLTEHHKAVRPAEHLDTVLAPRHLGDHGHQNRLDVERKAECGHGPTNRACKKKVALQEPTHEGRLEWGFNLFRILHKRPAKSRPKLEVFPVTADPDSTGVNFRMSESTLFVTCLQQFTNPSNTLSTLRTHSGTAIRPFAPLSSK